jgi:hypothetical protein
MLRILRLLLLLLVLVVLAVLLANLLRGVSICPQAGKTETTTTLAMLRSEPLLFLATDRGTSLVLVEHSQWAWWGSWRGVLWATVTWRWGIDLRQLRPEDIRREGSATVVRLPEPRLLDFGLEPGSVRLLTKSTALSWLQARLSSTDHRQALENRLQATLLDYAVRHDLLPSRQTLVDRLNAQANAWGQADRLRFE